MYLLTLDSTLNCLTIENDNAGGKAQERVFYADISDVFADCKSTDTYKSDGTRVTLQTNYSNGNFNLRNRVTIMHGDSNSRFKNSVTILDLINFSFAWSSAPTVILNDAMAVASLIDAARANGGGSSANSVSGTFTSSTLTLNAGSAVWSGNNIVVTLPRTATAVNVSILNAFGTTQLTAGLATLVGNTVTINMSGFLPITGTWSIYITYV